MNILRLSNEGYSIKMDSASTVSNLFGVCVSDCEDGKYSKDNGNGIKYCADCEGNCQNCMSASICTKCINNMVISLDESYKEGNPFGTCISSCSTGTYKATSSNAVDYCAKCPEGCSACSASDKCTSCDDTYSIALHQEYESGNPFGLCVEECETGTYSTPHSSNNENYCKKCPDHCTSCSAEDKCNGCESGYTIKLHSSTSRENAFGTCVQNCDTGYYNTTNSADIAYCQICPSNCLNCTEADECSQCNSGFSIFIKEEYCIIKSCFYYS